MTVEELLARCDLVRASEKKLTECKPFSCGEGDLDEFFANDCLVNQRKLLDKTYLFCLKSQPDTIVTAFSLSNDSIRLTNRITDEYKEQFLEDTDLRDKTMVSTNRPLKRFPAVLIGRLGTSSDFAGQGFGTAIMDFIKLAEDKSQRRLIPPSCLCHRSPTYTLLRRPARRRAAGV